jgi:hypothetical protein
MPNCIASVCTMMQLSVLVCHGWCENVDGGGGDRLTEWRVCLYLCKVLKIVSVISSQVSLICIPNLLILDM